MVLPDRSFTRNAGQKMKLFVEAVTNPSRFDFTPTPDVPPASNVDSKKSEGRLLMFKTWLGLLGKVLWGVFVIALLAIMVSFGLAVGWQLGINLIP